MTPDHLDPATYARVPRFAFTAGVSASPAPCNHPSTEPLSLFYGRAFARRCTSCGAWLPLECA